MRCVDAADVAQESGSDLLAALVTPGRRFPKIAEQLERLEQATDWAEAQSSGRVVPHPVRLLPPRRPPASSPTGDLHAPTRKNRACKRVCTTSNCVLKVPS